MADSSGDGRAVSESGPLGPRGDSPQTAGSKQRAWVPVFAQPLDQFSRTTVLEPDPSHRVKPLVG